MLFRVTEHYDDLIHEIDNENTEYCFICHEIDSENEIKPLNLKTQNFYIKRCECNGLIHKNCLDIWCSINKNCPICRSESIVKVIDFVDEDIFLLYCYKLLNLFIFVSFIYYIISK
jgi:hypothetical protein